MNNMNNMNNMNLRLLVLFCAILFGKLFSTIFIYDWVAQWIQRPFEAVKTKVMKQSVPFPSISLCLEGTTLWPAWQCNLNWSSSTLPQMRFLKSLKHLSGWKSIKQWSMQERNSWTMNVWVHFVKLITKYASLFSSPQYWLIRNLKECLWKSRLTLW